MPTEMLTIAGPAGNDLSAALELPDGEVRGAALYAHCFTCTKQSRAAVAVSRRCSDVSSGRCDATYDADTVTPASTTSYPLSEA